MEYTIIVDSVTSKITPRLPKEVIQSLKDELRYKVTNYQFTSVYKQNPDWDGYKTMFFANCTFSTGLVYKVSDLLKKAGFNVKIQWVHNYEAIGSGEIYSVIPFDFQIEAVKRAVKSKYCVIDSPVRSGKTTIIAMLISKINQFPAVVVTKGSDLILQNIKSIEESLNVKIGKWAEGECDLSKDIIVTNYENMVRLPTNKNKQLLEYIKKTKVLILDECHLSYTDKLHKGAWTFFTNIGYKIGLSGTPVTSAVSKSRIPQLIGPIVYKVQFEKLIDIGRIAQPKILVFDLPISWFQNFNHDYMTAYEVNIVQNVRRNKLISKLVEKFSTKKVFIIVRKRYHGELLKELIPNSIYVHGEVDSDIRKDYYNQLNEGKINCIIATVGKLGLDIPNLDIVINAEGIKAETATIQKMRSLTASVEKDCGIVIDFIDKGKYTYDHAKSRFEQYNSIKGFQIKTLEIK